MGAKYIVGLDTETITEADGRTRFYSLQAFSPELSICLFTTDPDDVARLFTKRTSRSWFVAHRAEFDFLVIKPVLLDMGATVRVCYSKSRFLAAYFKRGNLTWRLVDLANLFPNMSLFKVGRIIGVEKLPRPPFLGEREPTAEELSDFRRYAMRDAEIAYRAARWLFSHFKRPAHTVSSLSLRSYFDQFNVKKVLHYGSSEMQDFVKRAYRGGRVEVFTRGKLWDDVFVYDFNSLYPAVAAGEIYPMPMYSTRARWRWKHDVDLEREGFADVLVRVEGDPPPLGVKRAVGREPWKKLVFPSGTIRDVFTYPELRYLEDYGWGRILRVFKALECPLSGRPFKSYILDLWKRRKKALSDKNPSQLIYKYLMNALLGKLAQRGELTWFKFNDKGVERKDINPRLWRQPIFWAAYVTAYGRLRLHRALAEAKDAVYCDTDSLFTLERCFGSSPELGRLKLEGRAIESLFIRAKFYAVWLDRKWRPYKVACKGLFLPMRPDELEARLASGRLEVSSKRLLRFREALRRHEVPISVHVKKITLNPNEDGKRLYHKHLGRRGLLLEYTGSSPVELKEG